MGGAPFQGDKLDPLREVANDRVLHKRRRCTTRGSTCLGGAPPAVVKGQAVLPPQDVLRRPHAHAASSRIRGAPEAE